LTILRNFNSCIQSSVENFGGLDLIKAILFEWAVHVKHSGAHSRRPSAPQPTSVKRTDTAHYIT
jgi:hypothetical protein